MMVSIDKTFIPHCYVEEKKFDWGEPYTCITPIFNVGADPELSDIAFTIEILGKNNFKDNLMKLYNILLNQEEKQRLHPFSDTISDRESLLQKISGYLAENAVYTAPWKAEDEYELADETIYLEYIEHDLDRNLCYERTSIK